MASHEKEQMLRQILGLFEIKKVARQSLLIRTCSRSHVYRVAEEMVAVRLHPRHTAHDPGNPPKVNMGQKVVMQAVCRGLSGYYLLSSDSGNARAHI